MTREFKIGDHVKVISKESITRKYKKGIIVHIKDSGSIGVDFGPTFNIGHSCNDHCKIRQGFYMKKDSISLIEKVAQKNWLNRL